MTVKHKTATRTTSESHLWLTDAPDHCELIAADANAFLIGYILDQQVTVQKAFRGPWELRERIGTLDPAEISRMPLDYLKQAFSAKPALHRFPAMMAERVHQAMRIITEDFGGDSANIWLDARDYDDLGVRVATIPGLGKGKLIGIAAILTQRCAVPFDGWQSSVPEFGTLGDVDSPEALHAYQAAKRAYKKAARSS